MGVYLQPGANALNTADAVREALDQVSGRLPEGMVLEVPYDTTKFVEIAINEVVITLLMAVLLVVIVTYLFLQKPRATLIPVLAIPVSLIGTFAGMQAMGFSINLLTLFGLVLAIGVVVDNAIIVLENVDRLMKEEGQSARDATIATMEQVAGAVVSSTLVLMAVFAPVAFLGGLTGELYRQFAVTIAISVFVSGIVALTLTPATCALLLEGERGEVAAPFRLFNRGFDAVTRGYVRIVTWLVHHRAIGSVMAVALTVLMVVVLRGLPTGLVPAEDQGTVLVVPQLPPVSALNRTAAARDELTEKSLPWMKSTARSCSPALTSSLARCAATLDWAFCNWRTGVNAPAPGRTPALWLKRSPRWAMKCRKPVSSPSCRRRFRVCRSPAALTATCS